MTTVTFSLSGKKLVGFTVSGHAGYDEEGRDIVCSAVSAMTNLVFRTLEEGFCINPIVEVDQTTAKVFLKIPNELSDSKRKLADTVLESYMLELITLKDEYPEFISVLEENNND